MEVLLKAGVGYTLPLLLIRKGMVIIITHTNEKTRFCPIFNLRLAGYLMTLGFPLMNIGENERFAGRKVFYFIDSPQIKEAMDNYLTSRDI